MTLFDVARDFVSEFMRLDALKRERAIALEAIEKQYGFDLDNVTLGLDESTLDQWDAFDALADAWDAEHGLAGAFAAVTAAARKVCEASAAAARAGGMGAGDIAAIVERDDAGRIERYAIGVAKLCKVWPTR